MYEGIGQPQDFGFNRVTCINKSHDTRDLWHGERDG